MLKTRVIPCLLLRDGGLVKGVQFRNLAYVGDPINAVRIFNNKEVDEIIILDTDATSKQRGPDLAMIRDIVEEAFMPTGYGGGITDLEQVRGLLELGVEKVILNSVLATNPGLVTDLAEEFGSQAVVVSIDVAEGLLGRRQVMVRNGRHKTGRHPVEFAREMVDRGAGEVILTSISREGTGKGYDCDLIREVSATIDVPVVANGGAGKVEHFSDGVAAGASAVAAGSMFVYHGPHRAPLVSYPPRHLLEAKLP